MRFAIPFFLLAFSSGLASSLDAAVIGYFESTSDYREIDPATGQTTLVANAGGGSIANTIFALDQQSGIAYRGSSPSILVTTDLATGVSSTVSLSGSAFALGVFGQRLIGYFDFTNDYREIDPATGQTTLVASAGGGSIANTIFALDQQSGIAYRGSSPSTLVTTDLATGVSSTVSLPGSAFALGVFGHRLIGYFDFTNDYREIDPATGQTTFVASAGGGSIANTIFALDQQSGIAYRGSSPSTLVTTDLTTGVSSTVSLPGSAFALGVHTIPEPSSSFCIVAGLGLLCFFRRRRM